MEAWLGGDEVTEQVGAAVGLCKRRMWGAEVQKACDSRGGVGGGDLEPQKVHQDVGVEMRCSWGHSAASGF